MRKRSWLVPTVMLGAALFYLIRHRVPFERIRANVRAFDMPTAGMYDALIASLLGGFYERVADEVAASIPIGTILEVGSGPGQLAVLLARKASRLTVTGVDSRPKWLSALLAGRKERVSASTYTSRSGTSEPAVS